MAFNSKAQEAERYMDLCKFKTSHSYIVRPHLKTTNIKTKQNNNHQGVRLERWLSVVKSTGFSSRKVRFYSQYLHGGSKRKTFSLNFYLFCVCVCTCTCTCIILQWDMW